MARLTIRTEQEVGRILTLKPLDPVNLLLNLQGFEIIELRLVRLELAALVENSVSLTSV